MDLAGPLNDLGGFFQEVSHRTKASIETLAITVTLEEKDTPNKRSSRVGVLDNGFTRSTSGILELPRTMLLSIQNLQSGLAESNTTFRPSAFKSGVVGSTNHETVILRHHRSKDYGLQT